jgi:sulfatase modifying factor 1
MKLQLIPLLLWLCVSNIQAQQKTQHYRQEIKGTALSFTMEGIPAGEFLMGSTTGKADERPVHRVKVDAFWMATHELTWDLYEPFLYKDFELSQSTGGIPAEVDAITRPSKPYLDMTFGMGKENHPALGMTHYNAIQYCKWLYARTGVFYRLPTEAEWEYACRAGSATAYSFGEDSTGLDDFAWYKANSGGKTHAVGLKKANPWGLFDLHGNVAEWTFDQYQADFYALQPSLVLNPVAKPDKLYAHVIRGGAYEDSAKALRSAARTPSDPAWKQLDPQLPKSNWWFPEAPFVGMRIVRPLKVPTAAEIAAYYDQPVIPDY